MLPAIRFRDRLLHTLGLAMALALVEQAAQRSQNDDYMSAKAHASVEALKSGAVRTPTNGSNSARRSPLLRHGISGGPVA